MCVWGRDQRGEGAALGYEVRTEMYHGRGHKCEDLATFLAEGVIISLLPMNMPVFEQDIVKQVSCYRGSFDVLEASMKVMHGAPPAFRNVGYCARSIAETNTDTIKCAGGLRLLTPVCVCTHHADNAIVHLTMTLHGAQRM